MRILLFNEYTRIPGGVDSIVNTELRLLSEYNVFVSTFTFMNSTLDEINIIKKIKILFLSLTGKFLLNSFQTAINNVKPDVVHIHNSYPLFRKSIWDNIDYHNSKIILHLHNYYPFCLNSFFYYKNSFCNKCLIKNSWIPGIIRGCYQNSCFKSIFVSLKRIKPQEWLKKLKKVSLLIVVSRHTAREYINCGVPSEKITVIPNTINEIKKLRKPKGKYVLFLGNIRKEKGIELLVQTAIKNPDINFIAAGDGPDLLGYKKKYLLRNLFFPGFVSGKLKEQLLMNAVFLFHPSLCPETFGLVIIEAYSYGLPVLTTSSGAIKEVIIEGETGRIYKNNLSVTEFWKELDTDYQYYEDNCRKMAGNFLPENHLMMLISAYRKVLK